MLRVYAYDHAQHKYMEDKKDAHGFQEHQPCPQHLSANQLLHCMPMQGAMTKGQATLERFKDRATVAVI